MKTIGQMELFLVATVAWSRGESAVYQCSWCGGLVCVRSDRPLGDCPTCSVDADAPQHRSWWEQTCPVGPFDRSAA